MENNKYLTKITEKYNFWLKTKYIFQKILVKQKTNR